MTIAGKVVVITGASKGIGEAVATSLSLAGARLVLTARNEGALAQVAVRLQGEVVWLAADAADPATPDRLLQLARQAYGRVDALVNNAASFVVGAVDDLDVEAAAGMIRLNFEALMRGSYVFGRAFKAQGSGSIVNVSSIAAFGPRSTMGVYAASKAAVESFTGSLRVELGAYGVKVGAIAPGSTQTDMLDDLNAHRGGPPAQAMPPAVIAAGVKFMLEQPPGANVAGLQLFAETSPV